MDPDSRTCRTPSDSSDNSLNDHEDECDLEFGEYGIGYGPRFQVRSVSPTCTRAAPIYTVPSRVIGAVEAPVIVVNPDRAVKAFAALPDKKMLLDDTYSIPFHLNPESPWKQPVVSHGASSHNVVFKVTVPRRTWRRRKKGSNGPWEGEVRTSGEGGPDEQNRSRARLDNPRLLRRKLADNVDEYRIQPVGVINNTHRFRGLADFYWNMEKSSFVQRFMDQVATYDVDKMKEFRFKEGADTGPNVDIIPPPVFTHNTLPFVYEFCQNPYVREIGNGKMINVTLPALSGHFIPFKGAIPTGPREHPDMTIPRTVELVAELEEAFEERPIWTRRALLNRVGHLISTWYEIKKYVQYVSYQFKGGPWRDCIVKFGCDPRGDPEYRIYQSLMFQVGRDYRTKTREDTWRNIRRGYDDTPGEFCEASSNSHIFDGRTYYTDGKVWQVCDIKDPLLAGMLEKAAVRPEISSLTGWYHGGLWGKVKAIMRTKLIAIMFDRPLRDIDFSRTVANGDTTPPRGTVQIQLPNLRLTDREWFVLTGKIPGGGSGRRRHRLVVHSQDRIPSQTARKALEWVAAGGGMSFEGTGVVDGVAGNTESGDVDVHAGDPDGEEPGVDDDMVPADAYMGMDEEEEGYYDMFGGDEDEEEMEDELDAMYGIEIGDGMEEGEVEEEEEEVVGEYDDDDDDVEDEEEELDEDG